MEYDPKSSYIYTREFEAYAAVVRKFGLVVAAEVNPELHSMVRIHQDPDRGVTILHLVIEHRALSEYQIIAPDEGLVLGYGTVAVVPGLELVDGSLFSWPPFLDQVTGQPSGTSVSVPTMRVYKLGGDDLGNPSAGPWTRVLHAAQGPGRVDAYMGSGAMIHLRARLDSPPAWLLRWNGAPETPELITGCHVRQTAS